MVSYKQAMKLLKEGNKVFEKSDSYHIYSFKDGKYSCSCGEKVDWRFGNRSSTNWAVAKRNSKAKQQLIETCPECHGSLDRGYCFGCDVMWVTKQSKGEKDG